MADILKTENVEGIVSEEFYKENMDKAAQSIVDGILEFYRLQS